LLGPTLVLAFTWLLGLLLLLACGFAIRLALRMLSGERERRATAADLWIGLAALVAYLELWSLVAPIDAEALVAPVVTAVVVAAWRGRGELQRLRRSLDRRAVAGGGLGALVVLWLANRALARPTSYDSALYHFSAVEYASRYAAIPGIANLHERLGAANPHLLVVALAGTWPWRHAGFHVVNGLVTVMLLADIWWTATARGTPPASRRLALLLAPATIVAVALAPGARLSSPSLDYPTYVLAVAGTLHLCRFVERAPRPAAEALGATAAFAAAAATRPQFVPALIVAAIVVATTARARLRTAVLVAVVPAAVLAGCAARQAVLSGYPLFPLRLGALPVDWRVPGDVVTTANDWIRSWARTPGEPPGDVLGSWAWLPGWVGRTAFDPDVFIPLGLTLLATVRLRGARVDRRLVLLTLAPSLVTLVFWFVAAPDPRFVAGPIWLVPLVLLAARPIDERVALAFAVAIVATLIIGGAWRPVTKHGSGPFRSANPPDAVVRRLRTNSGLLIYEPAVGDLCWRKLLCTPNPRRTLELRRHGVADGFRLAQP
jgi:predicted outer membrane lipoprotein